MSGLPNRTPEFDQYLRGLRRQIDLERKANLRRPFSLSRRLEATIDVQQLPLRSARQLRVLAAGNGAAAGDIGKFWFVIGYSQVGGPDIVPET